jgi:hypothetical protein
MTTYATDRVDLFVTGTDSSVMHKYYDGNSWRPSEKEWESLGGQSIYEPVYNSRRADRINVFIINFKRELLHKWYDGNKWSDWQNFGGTWAERPSVVSWGPDRLDIFLIGRDGNLFHKYLDSDGNWSNGYEDMAGQFIAPVAAVARDKGFIDLFGTTPDHKIHHKWLDGNNWGPKGVSGDWENMGGTFYDMPKAVSFDTKRIDLFCVGDDSALYSRHWDGNKWNSSWESLGGVIHMLPEVVSRGSGHLDVFVIGTDHAVYHKYVENNQWKPSQKEYEFMSGVATDKLTALSAKNNRISLMHIGTDSVCYLKTYDGKWKPGLTGYISLGGTCMSPVGEAS